MHTMNVKHGSFFVTLFLFLLTAWVFLPVSVSAQIPPAVKAGAVEKELVKRERPKLKADKEIPVIELKLPEEELVLPEGARVLVKEFRIRGNTIIKMTTLKRAVSKYENQTLGFQELNEACLALT